jgi:hypothetical protein
MPAEPSTDRRTRHDLRVIFSEAFEMLSPFFALHNGWGSHSSHEHLAYRALKERFPMLSAQDCVMLVMTAKRVRLDARAADNLTHPPPPSPRPEIRPHV